MQLLNACIKSVIALASETLWYVDKENKQANLNSTGKGVLLLEIVSGNCLVDGKVLLGHPWK